VGEKREGELRKIETQLARNAPDPQVSEERVKKKTKGWIEERVTAMPGVEAGIERNCLNIKRKRRR